MTRIGFSGHQGLPESTARLVDQALRDTLAPVWPLIGITMLGPGADQLFGRAVLDRGGFLEVVIPATRYRDSFEDPQAQAGYDQLFSYAKILARLPFEESTEEAHMAAGRTVVDHSDLFLACWDGEPSRGHGGTADVVAYARERRVPVEVIWPPGATRD